MDATSIFVIRNTFVEFIADTGADVRRSLSEPPSRRANRHSCGDAGIENLEADNCGSGCQVDNAKAGAGMKVLPIDFGSVKPALPTADVLREAPRRPQPGAERIIHPVVTTITIHNIRHKMSEEDIRVALDEAGYAGTYDFVFTPTSRTGSYNSGVVHINFLTEEVALRCWKQGRHTINVGKPGSRMRFGPSRVQGRADNEAMAAGFARGDPGARV
mmetsp:Transcript_71970/g.191971  ORF Transcript_71970/g.191971 Transcript_71970/m.191971 type:complete len:216 (+) Transcript_71970:42-689(+)